MILSKANPVLAQTCTAKATALSREVSISNHLRNRGTAVVIQNGEVLLVRDKGRKRFSLPGGGVRKGEPSISAAARELYEELGVRAISVERLRDCDFRGAASHHKVCLITQFDGHPHLKGHELDKFIWWDMKQPIPAFAHVKAILGNLDRRGKPQRS